MPHFIQIGEHFLNQEDIVRVRLYRSNQYSNHHGAHVLEIVMSGLDSPCENVVRNASIEYLLESEEAQVFIAWLKDNTCVLKPSSLLK